MILPTSEELTSAIENAARKAISDLFSRYAERFYYCSLITDGQAHAPVLSAWSVEALERSLRRESNPEEARLSLKWSYADSPYFAFGEEYFHEVNEMFSKRPQWTPGMAEETWEKEYQFRLNAMESAMARLDAGGLFGKGEDRLCIVVNVEVMPPDYGNTERAFRLNPTDALACWLEEIAEEPWP